MKIAHARERHAAAGVPFRLFAAVDVEGRLWLDLEIARRRATRRDERLAHNDVLFRQPITTLDEHLARGLRVATLGAVLDGHEGKPTADDDALFDSADLTFG